MEKVNLGPYDTLTDWMRAQASVITYPIARVFQKLGLRPNTITLVGLGLNFAVGAVIAGGYLRLGGALVLLASAFDALDGALARVSESKTRFGAFLDSTMDRISEGALLFGLLVWLTAHGPASDVYLVYLTLLGSLMVSYTRARAEGVGYACKVGLLTRVERIVILGVGLMLAWIRPTLWLMAIFTWVTVVQRILYVYREAQQTP